MFISHRFFGKYYFACILITLIINGCTSKTGISEEKIEKLTKYDYTKFSGHAIFLRSYDRGDPIYSFYSNGMNSDSCTGFVRIVLQKEKRGLKEYEYVKMCVEDSLTIDSARIVLLTQAFDSLGITHVSFDSTKSIFIGTNDGPINLIWFSEERLITDEVKQEWEALGNRWYIKVE